MAESSAPMASDSPFRQALSTYKEQHEAALREMERQLQAATLTAPVSDSSEAAAACAAENQSLKEQLAAAQREMQECSARVVRRDSRIADLMQQEVELRRQIEMRQAELAVVLQMAERLGMPPPPTYGPPRSPPRQPSGGRVAPYDVSRRSRF